MIKLSIFLLVLTIKNLDQSKFRLPKQTKTIANTRNIKINNKFPKYKENTFQKQMKQFEIDIKDEKDIEQKRQIYQKSIQEINQHNKKKTGYLLGINQFSFLNDKQKQDYLGDLDNKESDIQDLIQEAKADENYQKYQEKIEESKIKQIEIDSNSDQLPKINFFKNLLKYLKNPFKKYSLFYKLWRYGYRGRNWKSLKKVTSVKNQKNCGSCWAFATNAAVESIFLIKQKKYYNFSEQDLIDCGPGSCSGGLTSSAMKFVKGKGVNYEHNYPYKAKNQTCQNKGPKIKIQSFKSIPSYNMYSFIKALHKQPVTVAYYVTPKFQQYKSGIINPNDNGMCPSKKKTNHAVLAVGYYLDKKNPSNSYILFKNSWGKNWGEQGYFRFKLSNKKFTRGPCNLLIYGWKILSPKVPYKI